MEDYYGLLFWIVGIAAWVWLWHYGIFTAIGTRGSLVTGKAKIHAHASIAFSVIAAWLMTFTSVVSSGRATVLGFIPIVLFLFLVIALVPVAFYGFLISGVVGDPWRNRYLYALNGFFLLSLLSTVSNFMLYLALFAFAAVIIVFFRCYKDAQVIFEKIAEEDRLSEQPKKQN